MVPIYKKMNFLNFMLKKTIIVNKIGYSFFKELSENGELLMQTIFMTRPVTTFKYSITIDTKKKFILCRINGKYYKSYRHLRYIMRALKNNPNAQVAICILSNKEKFNEEFAHAVYDYEAIEDLINGALVEYVLADVNKAAVQRQIDEALDNKDFDRVSSLYQEHSHLWL